jgi:cysteine synthase
MKDRMARALIECAAADGRLSQRGTVVEYTAGTIGISPAVDNQAHFVFSDAFSEEKRYTMRAYGAKIADVPSDTERSPNSSLRR